MPQAKRKHQQTLIISEIDNAPVAEHLTMQAKLRAAAFDGVSQQDVTAIVKGMVVRAKEGDQKAAKMVFDYLLGANQKPQPITVNNYYESIEPIPDELPPPNSKPKLLRQS